MKKLIQRVLLLRLWSLRSMISGSTSAFAKEIIGKRGRLCCLGNKIWVARLCKVAFCIAITRMDAPTLMPSPQTRFQSRKAAGKCISIYASNLQSDEQEGGVRHLTAHSIYGILFLL